MSPASRLTLARLPAAALGAQPADWWRRALGVVRFGDARPPCCPDAVPQMLVRTPPLDEGSARCDVWLAGADVCDGTHGRVRYRRDDGLLFGCIELDENEAATTTTVSALQTVTASAYREVFELLDDAGYSQLFRVWNYFPAINAVRDGSERYWQFNAGRQDTFAAAGRATAGKVPAACALGSAAGGLAVYFLALREAPRAIENPRQVHAYDYPSRYGPRSPTFARASLAGPVLFVSGTASIVGHRTVHHGDAVAQTLEALHNIEAVLAEAQRDSPRAPAALADLAFKVYVRDPADLAAVRTVLADRLGPGVPVQWLQADVCRADLLVEIEASGGHAVEEAA